jgi:phosphoglycolate phosphatase
MGRGSMDLPLLVCIGPPLPVAFQMLLGTDDPALIEKAIEIYRERFERIGMFENALFPGIAEGLALLQGEGHRMRLVTAKPQPYARAILQHFGIDMLFEGIHDPSLDDRSHNKVALLASALHGHECTAAVMIGDRAADIHAAHANGIPSIAVGWGYGSEAELAEAMPTYCARAMAGVLRCVEMQAAS